MFYDITGAIVLGSFIGVVFFVGYIAVVEIMGAIDDNK